MVRHGGCLGLGLAAMGSHRQDVYEQLKFNLYQDDAVTGEAAGIAMGMVMLGSRATQAIEDMVAVMYKFHFMIVFSECLRSYYCSILIRNILIRNYFQRAFHMFLYFLYPLNMYHTNS